jgi:hypothetical protein
VDDILRRKLIEALKNSGWAQLDAERTATFAAGLYQAGAGEWKIWPSGNATGPDHYRVARRATALSVYDSPLEGRARDVASALNEIERSGSDATGTP